MVILSTVFDLTGVEKEATLDAKGDKLPNNKMFVNVSRNLIANYATNNRGLTYEEQRIYGKLITELKLLESKPGLKVIKLEDDWYEFLKKTLKTKMMPGQLMSRYYDLIENPLPTTKK